MTKAIHRVVGILSLLILIWVAATPWEFYSSKLCISLSSLVLIAASLEIILSTKNHEKRLVRAFFSGVVIFMFWVFAFSNPNFFSNQFFRFRMVHYKSQEYLIEIQRPLLRNRKSSNTEKILIISKLTLNRGLSKEIESVTIDANENDCIVNFPLSKVRYDQCLRKIYH